MAGSKQKKNVSSPRKVSEPVLPSDYGPSGSTLVVPKPDSKQVKRHSIHGITEEIDIIKPHQEIAILSMVEKQYLFAVERGDIALTKKILEDHVKVGPDGIRETNGSFNVDCMDPLGRSAVLIAIENENLDMLKLLIKYAADTTDALFCAISEEFVEAVETLIEHEEKHHRPETLFSWESGANKSPMFAPDMTPLVLAAHKDNYEIIKILLDKGAKLPVPHDVKCGCIDCVQSLEADCLQHSHSRINAYRALSSPSLIALSSKDPILTAFELSWELRRLSRLEAEFKSDYEELMVKCQDFATALLDHTRTSNELKILLNHDNNSSNPKHEHSEQLTRLKLAIKLKQKKFVAHPNVQQLLTSMWYEGLPGFRRKNIFFQFWEIISIAVIFPILYAIYIVAPRTRVGQVLRKPFIKFICHSASYFAFLIMLLLTAVEGTKTEDKVKMGSVSIPEWFIMFWVYGFIWSEIKQMRSSHFKEYITNLWNILDLVTNSFYTCTIVLRIILLTEMCNRKQDLPEVCKDVIAVHDALFSMANILSALKLVYIFSVNPYLGPLQIVLSRVVLDIAKFFLLYLLVLFAFACGVYQLLGDFGVKKDGTEVSADKKNDTMPEESRNSFGSIFESIQVLFWSAFGVLELDEVRNLDTGEFIKFWGLLTWGTYSVISIVVLLNLLIAMMSTSHQSIIDAADVEWKYARSKLWISYFETGSTSPPPFNIIPTLKSIWYFSYKIKKRFSPGEEFDIQQQLKIQLSRNEFQNTVRCLVHRYIMAEQKRSGDNTTITIDDLNEVRQDISSLRYELMYGLQNSGVKIDINRNPTVSQTSKMDRKTRLFKGFDSQTDSFGNSSQWSIADDSHVSSPHHQMEISKREESKFKLGGMLPSIFHSKQVGKPVQDKKVPSTVGGDPIGKSKEQSSSSSSSGLKMKSKRESLEELIKKGLVTKFISKAKSSDSAENDSRSSDESARILDEKQRSKSLDLESGLADDGSKLDGHHEENIALVAISSESETSDQIGSVETVNERFGEESFTPKSAAVNYDDNGVAVADGDEAEKGKREKATDTEDIIAIGSVNDRSQSDNKNRARKISSDSQKWLQRQEIVEEEENADKHG